MSILSIPEDETKVNLPKHVETSFILHNNFYVVTNGEIFNYYPIKTYTDSKESPLIRFERLPPIILEGYAIVGKKIYLVPVQDLQRKIIRKSKEITRDTQNATDATNPQSISTLIGSIQSSVVSNGDESEFGGLTEMEITKAADVAWSDQIGALYNDPFEEEDDWEVQDAA